MSGVLTRIYNNQIANGTIWANAKIVPGSIVGSLFNSNLVTTSDITIGGNLTVLGTSQYATIASTNTYVNDPLIVLNNAFAGTNSYDIGFIFNRGNQTNQGFYWDEFNKEFRLVATTETGGTYGNVAVSSYSNFHLGNVTVDYSANVGSLTSSGGINGVNAILSGDLAVDGGDITTAQSMGNVFNANATSISAFGAATGILLGATTGTLLVNNPTIVGSQTTQNVFNANATTVNAFGAGTGITIGAASGFTSIRNANIWLPNATSIDGAQATVALLNTNATTINAFGAATAINLGASSGIATVNNTTLYLPTATNIAVGGASLTFANTVVATVNAFGSATSVFLGATNGVVTARSTLSATGVLYANAAADSTTTGTGALRVTGGAGITGNLNVGGNLVVNSPALINSTLSTTGVTRLYDTTNTAQTHDTGALQVDGGASISKDLWVGGNVYAGNIFGTQQQIITVQDPLLYLDAGNTYPYNYDIGVYSNFVGPDSLTGSGNVYQHTAVFRDNSDYTWKFVSNVRSEPTAGGLPIDSDTRFDPVRAGNLTLVYTQEATSATTGALQVAGGAGIAGNIFHTGTRLETSSSNYIFASTPTTVDAFKAATDLEIGATSGTLTVNNPTVVGSQTTQALFNTVATTINFGGVANINLGHPAGFANVQGSANIYATTASTLYNNGALLVQGGIGSRGNLNVASGKKIKIGSDLTTEYPENALSVTTSANAFSRVAVQNLSTGTLATSEFVTITDAGSNSSAYAAIGVAGSGYLPVGSSTLINPIDAYHYTTTAGNLVLAAAVSDVVIAAGGLSIGNTFARFSATNANVTIERTKITTSPTTGAFTVAGGVGFGANLNVAKGAVFNATNTTDPFQVKGTGATTLIYAKPGIDVVSIGGSNTAPASGITAQFNGTGAIIVPVGTTGERPGLTGNVDVDGMLRLNSSSNQLEYYANGSWTVAGSAFTIIAAESFSGNGVQTVFTLSASSTTAGTLVSINGVLQIPVTAYSISSTSLTFTEAPATGDVIDVRRLTTTATVAQLASGYTVFDAATNWGNILTGTSSSIARLSISNAGDIYLPNGSDILYDQSATNIAANATPYVVASRSQSSFTTAKYLISVKNATSAFQSMEAILVTDQAGNAYVRTYGIVNNGTMIGTLTANVIASSVKLWYTCTHPDGINANVKVQSTYVI